MEEEKFILMEDGDIICVISTDNLYLVLDAKMDACLRLSTGELIQSVFTSPVSEKIASICTQTTKIP